jgi:hypothetical protein
MLGQKMPEDTPSLRSGNSVGQVHALLDAVLAYLSFNLLSCRLAVKESAHHLFHQPHMQMRGISP